MEFLPDDAWYYFEIAQRSTAGQGLSFDGISITNGFHPLWMLCLLVLGRSGLPIAHSALAVQGGLLLAGLALSAKLTTRRVPLFIFWLLVLSAFDGLKCFVNGMESSLAFVLVVGALVLACRKRESFVLGLVVGLAVIARWTNVLLLTPPLLILLHDRPRNEIVRVVTLSMVAPIGALLWLWWATGHVVPVSAAIKIGGAPKPAFTMVAVVGCAFLAIWGWRRRHADADTRAQWGLTIGVAVLVAADTGLRGVVVPEIWTLWPHVFLLVLVASGLPQKRAALLGAVLLLIAVASWRHRLRPEADAAYRAAALSGEWLENNAPPSSIAAGWDVGFVAGHTSRTVVNLDGLVNSWEYKQEVLDRNRVDEYLNDELKPDYLVQDLPLAMLRSDPRIPFKGAELGKWYVRRVQCFDFSAATSPWHTQHKVALVLSKVPETPEERPLASRRFEFCASR